jgi:hypothetical protein
MSVSTGVFFFGTWERASQILQHRSIGLVHVSYARCVYIPMVKYFRELSIRKHIMIISIHAD